MDIAISEGVVQSNRHTSFYLAAGPVSGIPIIFLHGWPELSTSWTRQITAFAALGFRAIAPDMRGYGRSSRHERHEDYAIEEIVADMAELLRSIGSDKAVWVGHDWGSPIAWTLASHFPELCHGVANLCVPYVPNGFSPSNLVPLVDRELYPEDEFPAGQWEYWRYYEENFDSACRFFDENVEAIAKGLFRGGRRSHLGKPSMTAYMPSKGGWAWLVVATRDLPIDTSVMSEADFSKYVAALKRNGFFGPDSWYMNSERNEAYARLAANEGRIDIPALFVAATYDNTCLTVGTSLGEPMRGACSRLTEAVVESGHWMAQERPVETSAILAKWLARELPHLWIA